MKQLLTALMTITALLSFAQTPKKLPVYNKEEVTVKKDWLVNPDGATTNLYRIQNGKLVLSNGLVSRTFSIEPNGATVVTWMYDDGKGLYGESQLRSHMAQLSSGILGNPHSGNPTSIHATQLVKAARKRVLDFFRADDYLCVFTQNATGALKIVGESYPFDDNGVLLMLADNHNSVNGIRRYCQSKNGTFEYVPIHYENLTIDGDKLVESLGKYSQSDNKLFIYPAQSNVTGVKHDLKWIEKAHEKNWDVLLDAAAFVPTSELDLSVVKPDYVSISFYKMFGYPTGTGCLLIKKEKFHKLRKPWFAGGTVSLASVKSPYHYLQNNHERFEDGTVNYLGIPAITTGLDFISNVGIEKINKRVCSLMQYLIKGINEIKHQNGLPVAQLFGPGDRNSCGGTVIMNFFDSENNLIPFETVERKANKRIISIRTGYFCNPGIDEINNCLTNNELATYFSSRNHGSYSDMITYLGKMRGAVRVSVDLATTKHDLDEFIRFVRSFRDHYCTFY